MAESNKFPRRKIIEVEEHDGDVRLRPEVFILDEKKDTTKSHGEDIFY